MASTYSNLKIQLMVTGENTTTWGDVTNINLGTALEEAIVGSADVAFSNANVTLSLSNTNTTQTARNVRLNLTGTATSGYNLVVPAIEKPYIVNNGTDGTITVKNATGTGIAVPAGTTMWVYNDGTNVVDVTSYLTALSLGTALAVTSGGTGANTAAGARTALGVPANDGTGASGTWGINVSGNAATATNASAVTNGVYTTGDQTIGGTKTFSSTILLADGGFMFNSDGLQDTGISWASDGIMNVRANGVTVGQFTGAGFTGNSATATSATTATTANALNASNSYTVASISGTTAGTIPSGDFSTPNNATTGGIRLRGNATTGNAIIQFTNSASSAEWANLIVTSGGTMSYSGSITASGNVTAYSDARLKTDLVRIDGALDKIEKLAGYTYTRTDSGERQTGLLAQDVQAVLPEAVAEGEYLSVAYGNMMGLMVEAIKELRAEVAELRAQAVKVIK